MVEDTGKWPVPLTRGLKSLIPNREGSDWQENRLTRLCMATGPGDVLRKCGSRDNAVVILSFTSKSRVCKRIHRQGIATGSQRLPKRPLEEIQRREVHGGHSKRSCLACLSRRKASHSGHRQNMCSSSTDSSSPRKRHIGESLLLRYLGAAQCIDGGYLANACCGFDAPHVVTSVSCPACGV